MTYETNGELVDFPYKKYVLNDEVLVDKLFNNLMNYTPNFISGVHYKLNKIYPKYIFNTFQMNITDKPEYLYILFPLSDYININILSDFFSEVPRMKCKRLYSELTPEQFFLKNKESLPFTNESREKIYASNTECSNFKLTLALSVFTLFSSTRILDFSSGWGDRLLGAIAYANNNSSTFQYYHGTDPNQSLQPVYRNIIRTCAKKENENKFIISNVGFEKFSPPPKHKGYDLVFTSPPYFDFEIYDDGASTQSTSMYPTMEKWFVYFMCASLYKSWFYLNTGGYMVLSIEDFSVKGHKGSFVEMTNLYCLTFLKNCRFCGTIGHVMEDTPTKGRPLFVWKKEDVSMTQRNRQYQSIFERQYPTIFETLIRTKF